MDEVTLVGNDTGGALAPPLMAEDAARVARVALVSCNAFGNFPARADRQDAGAVRQAVPAMVGLFMQQLQLWAPGGCLSRSAG